MKKNFIIVVKYTNVKFTILTMFSIEFSGIKYILCVA